MNKMIIGAVVFGSVILAGCSGTSGTVAKINTQVAVLDKKVDVLASDVQALREDTQVAKAESARANQRLDNQTKFYKK